MARSKHATFGISLLASSLALFFACINELQAQNSFRLLQNSAKREKAAALVVEAATALELKDLAKAKEKFQLALRLDPRNVAAHSYLGLLADRAGDLPGAENHFEAAVEAAPLSAQTHNNYGAILLRLGRLDQAAKQFELSLRLDKDQPSALVNLAKIQFINGKPQTLEQARELFARAFALAPDAEIARSLVVTSLRLNDKEGAARYFHDYIKQLSTTGVVAEPSARVELGAALLGVGLSSEAIEELSAAAKAEPANVNTVLLLARAYLSNKDIPAAGRTLESAVARGVEAAPVYAALADVYELSGHIENSIPAMRLAIARDPQNEAYRFRYGMLLTDTQVPAAAVIRLKEALEIFPRSPKLWFALGIAYFTEHKSDEATGAFQRTLELDTKFAPALAYLGLTYREQGRSAEAVNFYERALALDEKLAVVHYLAADSLLREADPDSDRVEAHLRRAIALDPTFAPSRLALGKLYIRANRLDEAVKLLERAVALQPDLAEPHYQLGRLYVRLKRQEEAETELAKFKQLSEGQKEQEQNERRAIVQRLAKVLF